MQSLHWIVCYQTRNIRKHFQFHSHSLNAHRVCFDSDIFTEYARAPRTAIKWKQSRQKYVYFSRRRTLAFFLHPILSLCVCACVHVTVSCTSKCEKYACVNKTQAETRRMKDEDDKKKIYTNLNRLDSPFPILAEEAFSTVLHMNWIPYIFDCVNLNANEGKFNKRTNLT